MPEIKELITKNKKKSEATINDQELALTKAGSAYYFAREVAGAIVERCKKVVFEYCEKENDYWLLYHFLTKVPSAIFTQNNESS